jgi:hypothetical protein
MNKRWGWRQLSPENGLQSLDGAFPFAYEHPTPKPQHLQII